MGSQGGVEEGSNLISLDFHSFLTRKRASGTRRQGASKGQGVVREGSRKVQAVGGALGQRPGEFTLLRGTNRRPHVCPSWHYVLDFFVFVDKKNFVVQFVELN